MKLKTPDLPEEKFEMTPMIDVVFLLIIFFMVVAAQIIEQPEVDPPLAEVGKVPEEKGNRDTVSIAEDGTYYLGMRQMTIEELTQEIQFASKQALGDYQVYIRADEYTEHRHIKRVLQACAQNGIFNVIFATFKPSNG